MARDRPLLRRGGTDGERPPLTHDVPAAISPLVRRIVAANPGPMTGPGTNTYLIGVDEVAVVDPGPDDENHIEAIVGCGSGRIRWILLTHTHPDHWPATPRLAEITGAEVCAFAPDGAPPVEGLTVHRPLADGDVIDASEFRLRAVHTPGHASNHLCFWLEEERLLCTGDHIMDGSTVVIAPPDGDMAAYLDSLRKVRALKPRAILPGHGDVIEDPIARIDAYIAHRLERERQVLEQVRSRGPLTIPEIVAEVYRDVDERLHPVAARSVHAHLLKLAAEGRVSADGDPADPDARWRPA